jgi:NifB/MoaA-like Fe-S oxidoreductase
VELPPAEHYEDYPQLGNGVGSLRLFLSQFEQLKLPPELPSPLKVLWVVGNAVEQAFQPVVEQMNRIRGLQLDLLPIASQFWGQTLTVTGLLTGQDVLNALKSVENLAAYDGLLLPQIALKDGERFLDDLTWQDLQAQVGIPVVRVDGGPAGLVQAVQELEQGYAYSTLVLFRNAQANGNCTADAIENSFEPRILRRCRGCGEDCFCCWGWGWGSWPSRAWRLST